MESLSSYPEREISLPATPRDTLLYCRESLPQCKRIKRKWMQFLDMNNRFKLKSSHIKHIHTMVYHRRMHRLQAPFIFNVIGFQKLFDSLHSSSFGFQRGSIFLPWLDFEPSLACYFCKNINEVEYLTYVGSTLANIPQEGSDIQGKKGFHKT